ncbi:C6 transcription factor, putative [Paecilomyces variotii No. 5]|uniref:C6 transcription factor, putative n=1 Tax=Byssochlamys spectabilis (strain No. 5 / NBRC 109023) TaxID=1356009 RepID=V5FMT2_BYSSN|nr:C6 transcription factor, putative [Paecilomyces variotii No. 5]
MADKQTGASIQSAPSTNGQIYSRSCQTCNRRKVRCSRTLPCTNCVKSNTDCVFPGPGRAPRRKKRPLKAELVSRLDSLEEKIQGLTGELSIAQNQLLQRDISATEASDREQSPKKIEPPFYQHQENYRRCSVAPSDHQKGRLVVDRESSRYITHEALVSLGDQIKELQDLVESPNDRSEDSEESGGLRTEHIHNDTYFLFGYSCFAESLRGFHPSTPQSQLLWNVYQHNVAPVIMIFHKPTLQTLIVKASTNPDALDRTSEAVVFAVYYASVTSMGSEDRQRYLGEDHRSALQRYRFATQQALARAGFLHSRSLPLLQAAVLFFTCLRQPGDSEFVWTMTAAMCRIAQGLGLHRDGSAFQLSPFDTEMRRRLWWHIYLLDWRTAEYHAIGNQIQECSYDTKLPLNINDSDISPESTEPPEERAEFTEMTFCLVRCEMTVAHCRLPDIASAKGRAELSLEEHLYELAKTRLQLQKKYLRYCEVSVPIQWVTATVVRLVFARLWLIAHFSRWMSKEISLCSPVREQMFLTAIEVVEFAYLLETEDKTIKWSWFFEAYLQWHAAAFILAELCDRPCSPESNRAWNIVEMSIRRWLERDFQKGSMMLKPMARLMQRASVIHGPCEINAQDMFGASAQPRETLDPFSLDYIPNDNQPNIPIAAFEDDEIISPMDLFQDILFGDIS